MSNTSALVTCIGKATLDAILVADTPLQADSRVAAKGGMIAGGGPAATAAVALARQGIGTAFVGHIGSDDAGATIKDGLDREGIETDLMRVVAGGGTAFSAVIVDSADAGRLILTHAGALTPIPASADVLARCARSWWVHVDQVGWPVAAALGPAKVATPISVDGGNPIEGLDLSIVTLYAPSENGIRDASGTDDINLAMHWALDAGARLVVVTRGSAGAAAMGAFDLEAPDADAVLRDPLFTPGTRMVVVEPAPITQIISTLGAGDVFHGLLLAALCHGASVREAIRSANLGAAMSCAGLDGRTAIPDRAGLEEALLAAPQTGYSRIEIKEARGVIGEGTLAAFASIGRPSGALAMVAIDQRESLRALLSPGDPAGVPDADLVEFKYDVTIALAGHASALLLDRSFGLPAIDSITDLASTCGLIVAADVLAQTPGGPIRSVTVDHEAGPVAAAVGATALKLLVPWRSDQSAASRAALVREFIGLCREYRMLSLVEALVQDDGLHSISWYGGEGILRAAREMAAFDFDLYKAQVPTLGAGGPDEISAISERLTAAIGRPWVVLSNGVRPERFDAAVEAACIGGASGFLAGRAIWTSAIRAGDRAVHLAQVSAPRLERLVDVVDRLARPWHAALPGHPAAPIHEKTRGPA